MTATGWAIFAAAAVLQLAVVALMGYAVWNGVSAEQQMVLLQILETSGGMLVLAAIALVIILFLTLQVPFSWYVRPLLGLAEETAIIAVSNPKHRLSDEGGPELRQFVSSINQFADHFQALRDEVEQRIREANTLVEEEKNTLAALMSKLTQGVLVCNPDGRILLYNRSAQVLLEQGSRANGGGGEWIGLGRSVFGIIDRDLIDHALQHVRYRLQYGEDHWLMAPFVVARAGGQMLSANLVPILGHDRELRGYILTINDITRSFGAASRRGLLLRVLTEGQRAGLASIRAAIETVLGFPDMDEEGRHQFLEAIRDEAVKMSERLDALAAEYPEEMKVQMPFEEVLASDLLAAVEQQAKATRAVTTQVTAPLEPVWLRVDGYAVMQCLLFLIDQVRESCRAEEISLALEQRRSLAALQLEWSGATLYMEALRRWGLRNVTNERPGMPSTLFDIIEAHGGAIWPDRAAASGRPCLRVILPVSEGAGVVGDAAEDVGHAFDFHLFEQRGDSGDLNDMPLEKLSFTVLDTETTGLNPSEGDEIIAIGAVRVVNGRILYRETFDSFVRPRRAISPESQAIHGITMDMVRAEAPIEEVLPRLRRFVEDTVIVGHNLSFDMRFFELAAAATGVTFDNPLLDTLVLELEINPNTEDKSLEGIARRLGISVTGRHTALGDAITTAEVFLALLPILANRGITTLAQATALCSESRHAQIRY